MIIIAILKSFADALLYIYIYIYIKRKKERDIEIYCEKWIFSSLDWGQTDLSTYKLDFSSGRSSHIPYARFDSVQMNSYVISWQHFPIFSFYPIFFLFFFSFVSSLFFFCFLFSTTSPTYTRCTSTCLQCLQNLPDNTATIFLFARLFLSAVFTIDRPALIIFDFFHCVVLPIQHGVHLTPARHVTGNARAERTPSLF